ncbi:putative cyclin-A3-1 [Glycine soja]
METRAASKRKANAATIVIVEKQHPKRQRVVLGELSNLPNIIVPKTQNPRKEKLQCRKNPNTKKQSLTNNTLSFPQINESYVFEIFEYLHAMERKRRPMIDYVEKVQKQVTTTMRTILVDWLVEVAEEYKLLPDTLHLSVSYIDRFLSVNPVSKSRLQLLGVSFMLIAAKYEEVDPPRVDAFCNITDNTYHKAEVVKMEADILKTLKFEMGNPTVNTFLRRFADVASENQKTPNLQIEFLIGYLAELSLLDYDCLIFLPSILAASAIFLARFIIWPEVHPWTSSLSECLGYTPADLKECVLILHDLYLSRKAASFKAVRDKYKQHKFKYVANLPSPPHVPNIFVNIDPNDVGCNLVGETGQLDQESTRTRAAAKRKAIADTVVVTVEKQHPKKQRVVLGELTNIPNLILPETQCPRKEKLQCRKNPNVKKPSPTNNTLSSPHIDEPYVSDINDYLCAMERKRRPMFNYMDRVQHVVTENMRGILVDWLVEVAVEYKLLSETLHLSVSYIDRFLSVNPMGKSRLQLLGVSSMLIASRFLGVASENQKSPNLKIEFLSFYLAELSLMDYDCIRFLPSTVAASVIFLARFIISPEVHPWTSSLCECSGYKPIELKECVLILHDLYFSRKAESFKAVREKYKQPKGSQITDAFCELLVRR